MGHETNQHISGTRYQPTHQWDTIPANTSEEHDTIQHISGTRYQPTHQRDTIPANTSAGHDTSQHIIVKGVQSKHQYYTSIFALLISVLYNNTLEIYNSCDINYLIPALTSLQAGAGTAVTRQERGSPLSRLERGSPLSKREADLTAGAGAGTPVTRQERGRPHCRLALALP